MSKYKDMLMFVTAFHGSFMLSLLPCLSSKAIFERFKVCVYAFRMRETKVTHRVRGYSIPMIHWIEW